MSDIKADKLSLSTIATSTLRRVGRYNALWFLLLLVAVYGFVAWQIVSAHSAQPSDADTAAQVQASATPHIDPAVVDQMQSLQDHSVNVKTLFDQARGNPFQE